MHMCMADALAEAKRALELEEVELRRAKVARERATLEQAAAADRVIVRLNVGGAHFDTTRETLEMQSTYFRRLLDDGLVRGAPRDKDGRLFIDRAPTHFGLILEYLRGMLKPEALTKAQRSALTDEATYFGLDSLLTELHVSSSGYNPLLLSADDQQMRADAQRVRQSLADREPGAAADADGRLIDVYASVDSFAYTGEPSSPGLPLLFDQTSARSAVRVGRRPSGGGIVGFRERLHALAGPLLEGLDMANLVVAGGIVLRALTMATPEDRPREGSSDVDLFVVADTEEQAQAAFRRTYHHLLDNMHRMPVEQEVNRTSLLVVRTKVAVTFFAGWPQRNLQLVLRRHACAADVIFNFDVDACQFAYDGDRVLATPSARRALVTGINLADPERASFSYETRLAKYAERGFAVAVPGLEMRKVQHKFIQGCYARDGGLLKPLTLTFGGGALPTYTVGEPVVGLPKLIVLASMRFGKEPRGERPMVEPPRAGSVHESSDERRCYLISLSKLSEYGTSTTASTPTRWGGGKEEWRKPTPPAAPPIKLQVKPSSLLHGEEEDDYAGGTYWTLPFMQGVTPALATQSLNDRVREQMHDASEGGGSGSTITGDYIDDVTVPEARAGLLNVEDLNRVHPNTFTSRYHVDLPRSLQFTSSNSEESRNPFSRLPEAQWFKMEELYGASLSLDE